MAGHNPWHSPAVCASLLPALQPGPKGMSKNRADEKIRLLRALAFHIHKKEAPEDALAACFEAEGRGGKHRQWRQAMQVLQGEGFIPALLQGELIGADVASVLTVVAQSNDHRLLSGALSSLADHLETAG